MVCAPVRSIIPSLKLGDYLSVQAHKPSSISHLNMYSRQETQQILPVLVDVSTFRYYELPMSVITRIHLPDFKFTSN